MFRICSDSDAESERLMRWSKDGLMEPTDIFGAATLQLSLLVTCSCGHSSRFEGHCLWWHFQRRGWNDRLDQARGRFWCRRCASNQKKKVRPAKVEPVRWAEGDFELPWPDVRVWKRAVARVR